MESQLANNMDNHMEIGVMHGLYRDTCQDYGRRYIYIYTPQTDLTIVLAVT